MKFGHHGANHPVKDLDSGRVSITSQNHGFAVDPKTLPANLRPTHVSLFDGTLQGLARTDKPGVLLPGPPRGLARAARHRLPVRPLRRADGRPPGGRMPKRTDLQTILIIGAGPIIIGQACEFDYSGAQACKALREEGYRVILVNSNPATIMTDPEMADATYIEPITWQRGREDHRQGAARRGAADDGRPDGAQLRARPAPPRRAAEVRRRDDRRQRAGDREGRGPAEVQGRDDRHRPALGQVGHRALDGRGAGGAEAHRPRDRRQRLPDGDPPELHARRHRRRHRLQPGRVRGDLQARPRPLADQGAPDRGER